MENRWAFPANGDERDALVHLSNLIGADPSLTQPGGGNTSLKVRAADFAGREGEALLVKGSGTDLATIDRSGFTALRLEDLRLLRRKEAMSDAEMMAFMASCMLDPKHPAPSVETPLHSLLPYRCIAHTHDFATQALTDTSRPEALLREAFGGDVAYVPYVAPGFRLAKATAALGDLGRARGLVLGNHGLVTWGDSPRECYESLVDLIHRAERFLGNGKGKAAPLGARRYSPAEPAARRARAGALLPILRGLLGKVVLHYDDSDEVLRFVNSEKGGELARRGMATPEHILRCGRRPLPIDADFGSLPLPEATAALRKGLETFAEESRAAYAKYGERGERPEPIPKTMLLPGLGLVTAMRDKKNAVVGARCYRHVIRVMEAAETVDSFRFLEEKEAFEFEHWPLELVKLRQPERELSRRVALVTGGASGIGRAVAERLAAEGAHVVLTDLDGTAAERTAAELGRNVGDPSRFLAVKADATSEKETEEAFRQAVLRYGGVDILVCNAGFLQAGPVDQISKETWERHFAVNVRGYFLASREAVKVMKAQGEGVIVFNASKGAFAPAVDNSAYASSKAAAAALARNLAVELGPCGIRVNYFNADFVDTPLMRELIRQRAEMKGISPEAQRDEYRKRNLLNVGPIPPQAVAEAVLFLASDRSRYTTGSVITVDGGLREAMPR